MTGTGTQTDPFKPTSWDEFISAIKVSNAYVDCPENQIWDMNDVAPSGITYTTEVKAYNIKGNGLKIRNLRHTVAILKFTMPTSVFNFSDITFDNLYSSSPIFTFTISYVDSRNRINFSDVVINGIGSSSYLIGTINFYPLLYFTRCGINIESHNGALFQRAYTNMTDTHLMFKGLKFDNSPDRDYSHVFNNCLIEGSFDKIDYISGSSNIINAECASIGNGIGSLNIINKDKCQSYPDISLAVTTEQLKDADYLRSLGFPIGV